MKNILSKSQSFTQSISFSTYRNKSNASLTSSNKTPYWRTLKANGELNEKYPGGTRKQKEKLEAEGHIIIQNGRKRVYRVMQAKSNGLLQAK